MEFCGGHTHSICRYGLTELLPANVELTHGPGCPVCVLPVGRIEQALTLARRSRLTLCTFGDMLRVPGKDGESLLRAKALGADIRVVYGPAEALRVARENPELEVVFFAIGFETTTPTTALAVQQAERERLANFSVLCDHVRTPPAIGALLGAGETRLDGIIGPGHVCTIIGTAPFEPFARDFRKAIVVSGFEPLDLLLSIQMLIRQTNEGRAEVENQYARAVTRDGNRIAQALVDEVMELRSDFSFRGLGPIPGCAMKLRERYAAWDAERKFDVPLIERADHPACACGEILRGAKKPRDCRVFANGCTPETPLGACMVSPEGACAAYYQYGRLRRSDGGAQSGGVST
jgi:hydrogenase expression/formation protein HypD